MNEKQKEALSYLLEFASEVDYNDSRFAPKEVIEAVSQLRSLINES